MNTLKGLLLTLGLVLALAPAAPAQFATTVISSNRGSATNDYEDPNAVLGSPDRMTAEYPTGTSPVTLFNQPWGTDTNDWGSDQLFSIGPGGSLVVKFDAPVDDDATNPYGIDLIVFGNAGFLSADWPPTTATDPAGLFSEGLGVIEVSQDGATWFGVDPLADSLFPTTGWTDAAHTAPSNFFRPVDPSIALADFDGLTETGILALYDGSGGGTGVDIAGTGLGWIEYVRVTNNGAGVNVDIDAFADVAHVPEPGAIVVAAAIVLGLLRKRK